MAGGQYRHARVDALIGAAALSSLVFVWLVAVPALAPEKFARHAAHALSIYAHIAGGVAMLIGGAIALRIGLTREWFAWHKVAGYTYIGLGSVGAVTALWRSFDTAHTPGLSTGMLAAAWLGFTAMAWRATRNRKYEQHREWMIRSYVLAWTFVFCRFWTRAAPASLQGSETDMIWATWVGPILLAEMALQWSRGSKAKGAA